MVTILSINAQPHDLAIVQCREHNRTRVNVQCPAAMVHYQDFMGGVDRNSQSPIDCSNPSTFVCLMLEV